MLTALKNENQIMASEVSKEDAPFRCPSCKELVIVKKGSIKIHHFAHTPPYSCEYGAGETEHHRQAKLQIAEYLRGIPSVTDVAIEKNMDTVRPDVSCIIKGVRVAIEVQLSVLPIETIVRRTVEYRKKGMYILWVSPYQSDLKKGLRYAPKIWEKYIHAMYYGKLYYWIEGGKLLTVKFENYELIREGGYDQDAEYHEGGSYNSRRYKTPRFCDVVEIRQLTPNKKDAWIGGQFSVPACNILTHYAK